MTTDEIEAGPLRWVREQKKKLEKTPIEEIDPKVVQLIGDVEFHALRLLRDKVGKYE